MCDLSNLKIVIAGGSGFLGTSMADHFTSLGASVAILSRHRPKILRSRTSWYGWDGRTVSQWSQCLEGADALVNLAGRSVNCVKTASHKDEILRSRIDSTRILGVALRGAECPPPVWIQMSTAHIYGDPESAVCTEDSPVGSGFAPSVGKAWEAAFRESLLSTQRGVVMRASFVIGRNRGAGGGALGFLSTLARFGLGGRVGRGTQGMSWIHETDLNRLFARAITEPSFDGIYIASAPNPVSQMDFMQRVRHSIRIPIGLPASETVVRLGAGLFLRTDPELALGGRYVKPKRLIRHGFEFAFPTLGPALDNLLG